MEFLKNGDSDGREIEQGREGALYWVRCGFGFGLLWLLGRRESAGVCVCVRARVCVRVCVTVPGCMSERGKW